MYDIHLPLTRCMRLLAAAIVAVPAGLVATSSIVDVWRLAASLLILLTGLVSWRQYRRWRPVAVRIGPNGRLTCMLSAGDRVDVDQVLCGVVAPGLIMTALIGKGGETMSLIVPRRSLGTDAHWRLRRALPAWRPAGRPQESHGSQLGARGGR